MSVIISQAENRLRKPTIIQENTRHFHIIAPSSGIGYIT